MVRCRFPPGRRLATRLTDTITFREDQLGGYAVTPRLGKRSDRQVKFWVDRLLGVRDDGAAPFRFGSRRAGGCEIAERLLVKWNES